VFTDGEERLDLALTEGETVTFRHRVAVLEGHHTATAIEPYQQAFAEEF
jgi:hypothetical protein